MHILAAAASHGGSSTGFQVFAGIVCVLAVLAVLRFVLGWGPTKRTSVPVRRAAAARGVRATGRGASKAAARVKGSAKQASPTPEDA